MTSVDVIMLAKTSDEKIYQMTRQAIETLFSSDPDLKIRLLLVESERFSKFSYNYPNVVTLTPDVDFNYNLFLNLGLRFFEKTDSEFVVFANNDLVFHKNWLTNIIEEFKKDPELMSASPYSPGWMYHEQMKKETSDNVVYGYNVGFHYAGWILVFRKQVVYKYLFPLPEELKFWLQDNFCAYIQQKNGLKHALIINSKVKHLVSQSHRLIPAQNIHAMTHGLLPEFEKVVAEYEKKYGQNN